MSGDKKLIVVFFCDRNAGTIRSLIERGWSLAESLFPEFNLKIGKTSFGFSNEPKKRKSHILYDFKRSKMAALQENEKSNLLYVDFYSLPESYTQMSFEWLMEIQCGYASKPKLDRIQVGIDTAVVGTSEALKIRGHWNAFVREYLGFFLKLDTAWQVSSPASIFQVAMR